MDESHLVYGLLRRRTPGTMVDVGAHVGHTLLPFARRGWRIHAFEPDIANRLELERNVAGLAGVTVDPRAVSDAPGRRTLYASEQSTGVSTLAPFLESHRPQAEVEVVTLGDYMMDRGIDEVAFLKIDVEGWEQHVLNGYPWDRARPDVVLLEFEDAKTEPLGYTWDDLAAFLVGRGYAVLVSEWYPIVAYGRTHRWRRFDQYPSVLEDDTAWGNLVGVSAELMPSLLRIARRNAWSYRGSRALQRMLGRP